MARIPELRGSHALPRHHISDGSSSTTTPAPTPVTLPGATAPDSNGADGSGPHAIAIAGDKPARNGYWRLGAPTREQVTKS